MKRRFVVTVALLFLLSTILPVILMAPACAGYQETTGTQSDGTSVGDNIDSQPTVIEDVGLEPKVEPAPTEDTHAVPFPVTGIEIGKTGPERACVTQTITYGFEVRNTGYLDLSGVTVTDPLLGITHEVGNLGPAEVYNFEEDYTIPKDTQDPLVNTATVRGCAPSGLVVSDTDSHTVRIGRPGIEIVKTGPERACVTQTITYDFEVRNTGNMMINNVTVTDPLFGDEWSHEIGSMSAGEVYAFNEEYTIPKTTKDPLVNTATVTGRRCCGEISDTDSHTVRIGRPGIEIVKEGVDRAHVGDVITYDFEISNTGNMMINNVTVTDPLFGDGWSHEIGSMSAGETYNFDVDYTVPENAPDQLVNVATVTGRRCCGEISDEDDHTVDILRPDIVINKDGPATAEVGGTVTYGFVVENSGNTPLSDVTVTDPLFGNTWSHEIGELGAGETYTFDVTYSIPEGAPDPLPNTATASGSDELQEVVADDDDHTVDITTPVANPSGAIEVTKVLNDDDGIVEVGETMSYTIGVVNTGDIFIPAAVELEDVYDTEYLGYLYAEQSSEDNTDDGEILWSDVSGGEGLEPGESVEVTAYFIAKKAGASPETDNTVLVSAVDENGMGLTDEARDDATIIEQAVVEQPVEPGDSPEVDEPAESVPETAEPVTAPPDASLPVSGTLPYTGDNIYLFWILAGAMLLLGTGLILAHALDRGSTEEINK